jgi:hypothetical protein
MDELSYSRICFGREGRLRTRELQLLVNIIEPDPLYQPYFLSDEATLFDIGDEGTETIRKRLEAYFGSPLRFRILPGRLWKLVDEIKQLYPGWSG